MLRVAAPQIRFSRHRLHARDAEALTLPTQVDLPVPCSVRMSAKEQLRQAIDELSEPEAEEALAFIANRHARDPLIELFARAPDDDEPSTPAEDASADEARAQYERGESVPLDEIRHEFG